MIVGFFHAANAKESRERIWGDESGAISSISPCFSFSDG